jgi:2-polyprenyl-3-methyl-5-hydroxy-6-metoxy-1,4-benzoquinol methylase
MDLQVRRAPERADAIMETAAMSYAGLTDVTDEAERHLGGNVLEGDPFTFSPNVWDYLIKRFALKTVLDLGSGMGHTANYFHRAGLQVVAVDGLKEN